MQGIYKITNLINGHSYIGKSVDIIKRWTTHKTNAFNINSKEYDKVLYVAIRKYSLDNFKFEVLEETIDFEEREKYWIAYYDTFNHGYNETIGGEIGNMQHGENHSNAKLSKQDVIDIRDAYNNHERCKEVYLKYQDRIQFNGFHKIWKGETWKNVHMDVYTLENKEFHKHNTGQSGSSNGRSKLKEEDVYNIRLRKKNGETCQQVYQDYQHLITKGSFENVWGGYNWKHIIV